MQQAILYFPIRKYRFMPEKKNTTLEFLPLAGILTLIFRTLLYFFAQKSVFSALSAHKLKQTNKKDKNLALKGRMKSFKTKSSIFSGFGTFMLLV